MNQKKIGSFLKELRTVIMIMAHTTGLMYRIQKRKKNETIKRLYML